MRALAPGLALALGAAAVPAEAASAVPPECVALRPGGPVQVTPDCVDPLYAHPVIDKQQDLTSPVAHRRVSGHFEGTGVKFTFYLPPAAQWKGRYFQYTYPLSDESALDRTIAFGAASGGYTVQVSGTVGYRHAAAAAKFSEQVAADYYRSGSRRIHGYLYGPSGGSFQTIGAMENTSGVWDGAVPIVVGVPTSIPVNFFVRAQARMVLRDVAGKIADAVRPGGSGDPYAGLTTAQAAMLREATSLGVPLKAWQDPDYVLGLNAPDGLLGFGAVVRQMDPSYATDFWTKPGYLGTEQSELGDIVRAALIDAKPTIAQVETDEDGRPTSLTLSGLPALTSTLGLDFAALATDGTTRVGDLAGTLDAATGVFTVGSGNSAEVLSALKAGARVHADNRWFTALPSYYRHQVPPPEEGYTAFDVLRDADGTPLYPQRALRIGPRIASSTSGGGTYTGKVNGKVVVVDNLVDSDAYPWHADWYAQRVRSALGAEEFANRFRLYYNDNADHLEGPVTGSKASRIVSYDPIVEQALRDVAAWAERGVAPPSSTRYDVTDGQVTVPTRAAQRRGIQPVVDLKVRGGDEAHVSTRDQVTFAALAQAPPGAGRIVSASWDFTGAGTYTPARLGTPASTAFVNTTHRFTKPGTYYVTLKASSSRHGAVGPYAQVENLNRVRVVVHP
ncbi:Tat pathway signal sequence domain protein [Streptomyces dysideae]|uniref:Tat pathway signal sequence domain protein n=2 Tax=Streptomyces dysideae TaxID=909626 RepID=A0A101UWG2_9ACTN|nr:Tat pathway signal sequence domain protein [Streptomyces dysideae]